MAKLIVECNPCDQGHYGSTNYYCSECRHDCKGHVKKCPKCGVEFDEKYEFTVHPGFGGHDF